LVRMRMAILFCAFVVIRYLADLEHMYIPDSNKPQPIFLLDFSGDDRHPVRLASQRSYVLLCQAITRFYVWMFADYLRNQYDLDDLVTPPTYGRNPKASDQQVCREVWKTACDDAQHAADPYSVFGQALYDILALIAQATPIQYLRQIGIRGGAEFLWEFSYDSGMTVVHAEEFMRLGVEGTVQRICEVVRDGPVYVSFDVDSLDPAFAPGTGTPEAGGLSSREAMQLLRRCASLDVIGGDVVEVAPQYDATTNTAQAGAQTLFEILALVALARRRRNA